MKTDEPTVEQIAMMAAYLYDPKDSCGVTMAVRLAFKIWDLTVEKMNARDEQTTQTRETTAKEIKRIKSHNNP